MKTNHLHRICSLVVIITFLTATLLPQQLWGSWEEDAWEEAKGSLKITGIVVGSILALSLIIVLVVGAIEEYSDGEIIWMKRSWESSLQTAFLGPVGCPKTAFTPAGCKCQDTFDSHLLKRFNPVPERFPQRKALALPAGGHRAYGDSPTGAGYLPDPASPALSTYTLPFGRHEKTSKDHSFSLGIKLNPTLTSITYQ